MSLNSEAGLAVETADAFIAAVATCDTTPFEAAELKVINPWEAVQ